jgi:release factor glutamine methyltransferase
MPNLKQLKIRNSAITDLDWMILVADVINQPKEFVYFHPEFSLNLKQYLRLLWLVKKYNQGYPIAYLIGRKEFYNLTFLVNKHTLIPRPDTELMVDEAIKTINNTPSITLIDIGTGSGCVPIAILKNIKKEIPTIATDISSRALIVAQKNAATHSVKIKFQTGNLLNPIKQKDIKTDNLIITANLPYLVLEQINKEKSIKREPYSALYGGKDGLDLYRQLINQITIFFKDNRQKNIFLLLEIDPDQNEIIKKIINQKIPSATIKIRQDLAGLDRLVITKF